jgi:hypothetical protein
LEVGEGDAVAEGLATGLGVSGVPMGDGDVDDEGLAVFGALELLTGSVAQPAANTSENVVRSTRAARLIMFVFGVLICFLPRFRKIEKRDDNCATASLQQQVFPQTFAGPAPSSCTETLVHKKGLHDKRTRWGPLRVQALACVLPKAAT